MHEFFSYSARNHYFQYAWYNLELLRLLGSTPSGGCDAAEFLETVSEIEPNDAASWQHCWFARAEKTEALAEEIGKSGQLNLACNAFLRASNYFRCAQYMFPVMPEPEQRYLLQVYERSISCFERAMALVPHNVSRVQIPYSAAPDGRTIHLPGWLHQPSPSQCLPGRRKVPVLICCGGADSTQEELYFLSVSEGPGLGYAVLTFDGPGQGLVLRRDGVPMQPAGEAVLDAVINFIELYAHNHPQAELDLNALTVTGQSLGGYLALRGAAEHRIKACAAIDPFYDMWDLAMARMPSWMVAPWEKGWIGDWIIDWAVKAHGAQDLATKYQFALAQQMFGTPNAGSTLRMMKQYTFKLQGSHGTKKPDYLARVQCPVLVTAGTTDSTSFLPEISINTIVKNLVNVSESQKTIWVANSYAEGGAQAKSGAWPLLQHQRTHALSCFYRLIHGLFAKCV
ncbi:alpha/beta superfamily hydrolase [Talaromyces stipitatus ATCC 10500]|uniref:Alpha/beta superfamily hydrolase n=1 Tax=Talaromyces stipitatus (strain ATCC 10500 / CBS 375.48 / QM 6759 / NRRL 1006) TaxID=441959 RepID=B8MEY2_TALSN|nr:alpha/beta superfamily hydrolase [Talaromyces stipitatus ATCC 10500]EED17265.1 alpha/beta superfamily hydrolase [Talaromyces stipitatus ATCC 10500]